MSQLILGLPGEKLAQLRPEQTVALGGLVGVTNHCAQFRGQVCIESFNQFVFVHYVLSFLVI